MKLARKIDVGLHCGISHAPLHVLLAFKKRLVWDFFQANLKVENAYGYGRQVKQFVEGVRTVHIVEEVVLVKIVG